MNEGQTMTQSKRIISLLTLDFLQLQSINLA